jgi:predicted phosphodiesterase
MSVALVSDIHGNLPAFEAVLAELERRDAARVVCLGDTAQGGDNPAEVLDKLAELEWPVVLGNADEILLDPETEPLTQAQLERRAWSVAQLDDRHVDQMRSWPLSVDVDLGEGRTLLGFHASPRSNQEVLDPEQPADLIEQALAATGADILAGGHTHRQWTRAVPGGLYLNPGSVGVSDDGLAQFALVTNGWVQFVRVPF